MKRYVYIGLTAVFLILLLGCNSKKTEEAQIRSTIEGYYKASYDMWWNLKAGDLSKYLDLSSIQCYNKTVVLEENIERWKYSIEKGYYKGQRERHEIFYHYDYIKINRNEAQVKVNLSGDYNKKPIFPFFVSGENIFKLKKVNGRWLIYSHEYNDNYFYERSVTEKLEFDINKVREEVDRDYK